MSSNLDQNTNWGVGIEGSVLPTVTHMADSGIAIDTESARLPNIKQSFLTSTPKKSSALIPQQGTMSSTLLTTVNMSSTSPGDSRGLDETSRLKPPEYGATQKLNEILREKAKLEGQLEMLAHEAQVTRHERSELQSQIVTLKQKIKNQKDHVNSEEMHGLKVELDKMRSSRHIMEQSMASAQKFLDEKIMEAKILQEDLQVTQEANDKLQMRMKELRDDIRAKEMTIQALKNKIAELYVEVQTVMQTKMESDNEARGARSDLTSLVNAKLWYQQQLQAANETKSALQQELTTLQVCIQ